MLAVSITIWFPTTSHAISTHFLWKSTNFSGVPTISKVLSTIKCAINTFEGDIYKSLRDTYTLFAIPTKTLKYLHYTKNCPASQWLLERTDLLDSSFLSIFISIYYVIQWVSHWRWLHIAFFNCNFLKPTIQIYTICQNNNQLFKDVFLHICRLYLVWIGCKSGPKNCCISSMCSLSIFNKTTVDGPQLLSVSSGDWMLLFSDLIRRIS